MRASSSDNAAPGSASGTLLKKPIGRPAGVNAICTSRSTPGENSRTRQRYKVNSSSNPADDDPPMNGLSAGLPPPSSSMNVWAAALPSKLAADRVRSAVVRRRSAAMRFASSIAVARDIRTSRSRTGNASPNQRSTANRQSTDATSTAIQNAGWRANLEVTASFRDTARRTRRAGRRRAS